jgi:REG-2-like HAD superfamily hydrolase
MTLSVRNVRVISLDLTGTLWKFRHPVPIVYHRCAVDCNVPIIPSIERLEVHFKRAYKLMSERQPVYGYHDNISEREWWSRVVAMTFDEATHEQGLSEVNKFDMDRLFRHIYQYYARADAFEVFNDVLPFLARCQSKNICMGVTTNSPRRSIETTLPVLHLEKYFHWSLSCKDVRFMKPSAIVWDEVLRTSRHFVPNIQPHEILHIGDNVIEDYSGAKSEGFQAVLLRRGNRSIEEMIDEWKARPLNENRHAEPQTLMDDIVQSLEEIDIIT